MRFHDLRQFAATGASIKEIMSRGGRKSVAMVVRYEHAPEERDAMLAFSLNPYTLSENVIPISARAESTRPRRARDNSEVEGEVLALPPLTSENEEKWLIGFWWGRALSRITPDATKVLQA